VFTKIFKNVCHHGLENVVGGSKSTQQWGWRTHAARGLRCFVWIRFFLQDLKGRACDHFMHPCVASASSTRHVCATRSRRVRVCFVCFFFVERCSGMYALPCLSLSLRDQGEASFVCIFHHHHSQFLTHSHHTLVMTTATSAPVSANAAESSASSAAATAAGTGVFGNSTGASAGGASVTPGAGLASA
jgi:hypothetical protein